MTARICHADHMYDSKVSASKINFCIIQVEKALKRLSFSLHSTVINMYFLNHHTTIMHCLKTSSKTSSPDVELMYVDIVMWHGHETGMQSICDSYRAATPRLILARHRDTAEGAERPRVGGPRKMDIGTGIPEWAWLVYWSLTVARGGQNSREIRQATWGHLLESEGHVT